MTLLQKRLLILLAVILAAAVLGRLVVRAILNLLLGGTLFGGNYLRVRQRRERRDGSCGD